MTDRAKPYHHGDLRRALLDAALQLTVEQGIDNFSLREVARRAGVSNAAPYRHFPDKSALVETLAVEGWRSLERHLRDTWSSSDERSLNRVVELGAAYVQFALTNAEEFRLMIRPEFHRAGRGGQEANGVQQAANGAFTVLLGGIRQGQQDGLIVPEDARGLALTAWATVHGLAVVLLDELLPQGEFDEHGARQAASVVTRTLVRGLAVR